MLGISVRAVHPQYVEANSALDIRVLPVAQLLEGVRKHTGIGVCVGAKQHHLAKNDHGNRRQWYRQRIEKYLEPDNDDRDRDEQCQSKRGGTIYNQ